MAGGRGGRRRSVPSRCRPIRRVARSHRNLVAFRVHALLIAAVVALLERIAGSLRFARAGESTAREADAGANASTRAAAEEATGCRADRGTHGRAPYRAPALRIRYRGSADPLL